MSLRLEIVSHHRQSLGERGVKEFGVDGGTIGRSLESDWVLPDGQRYVSSRHASIDFRSGSYYIVDTSTNGVYVNGSDQAVGRGKPQRLFNGDRLRIGEYEMRVRIEEGESESQELKISDDPHVDPVDLAQRVPPPDPTTYDLVDAYEITGVGIEELLTEEAEAEALKKAAEQRAADLQLLDDAPARTVTEPPKPKTAPPTRHTANKRAADTAPAGKAAPPASPEAIDALDGFFRGAGIDRKTLDARDAQQLLHRLGQMLREVIVGVTENLHLRAEQKNTLRLAHTTIQPNNNNPLKFSAGVDEALNNLLFREASEYLPAVDAVREAFLDIRTHQQILLNAVLTALIDYMGRLDPQELEEKVARGAKRNTLMNAANRLKYWDMYKDLYEVVTQHAPGQFPQQFVEELSRAYELEAARVSGHPPQERQDSPKAQAG